MISKILTFAALSAGFAYGMNAIMPAPVGGIPWRTMVAVSHGESPYRAVPIPFGVTNLYTLSKCDSRVQDPTPNWDDYEDSYLVGLSHSEAEALKIAAETCKPGIPLPENIVSLAQHATDLVRATIPRRPTMSDAARLADN